MSDVLAQFHPLIQEWFRSRFEAPTGAQAEGWPAIARGTHTLVAAPTGSGKTLAAFMTCLDRLVRAGLDGGLPETTEVVYVSPLKALANDIERNLTGPLAEIGRLAEERGTPLPEIRVGLRTGDTPASKRQAMAKRPPHMLVTTPESLYILLTSESGRRGLTGVRTLILDELHAVADDKRGSHLSLSVERLCRLADGPITRIGLSATQRPIEEVGRFLVGAANISADGKPDCLIVDTGHAREMDLALELPEDEIGPIATHEQWDHALDRVAELVRAHHTTILFVNTRRLVERLAHQMSERLGEKAVAAHHGSLSQEIRRDAEQRLKAGKVKVCVATASLELGIDVGAVDLVCQVGSPRSIGLLLQRVGRSGHYLGGTPKGRLFPLTRDELIECMALVRGIRRQNLDTLSIPPWPLDVLAQQIVAESGAAEQDEDELFELARRAFPYRELPRERFDEVVDMLSRGVAPREGRRSSYVHRDAVNGKLRGRRAARLVSLTNGGAIPDNADYDVIAEPDNVFVGTVNEDFAVESMRGDVFLLGNNAWRIRRVGSGQVRVEDAGGASPTIPFWFGEAPGRTGELSDEVSELRDEIYSRVDGGGAVQWLVDELGVDRRAAEEAAAYLVEGVRVLGTVPTKKRVVAERFFDETGGMQLVIHAPFGSRINRAWGMALRKEICRTFDFELQASATEDGVNLSLGPSLSFPIEDVFSYVDPTKTKKILTQAVLQAPTFQVRWRWDASRALAVLRFSHGKKVPPALQRMRSDDLLAAVFPAQVACQDNAPPGDIEVPDHPLVFETLRDCLTEAMDLDGFQRVLDDIVRGEIEVFARDTVQPSAFSHQILNAMPYAFLDDEGEIAERRSRAVALRRALPEDTRDLAALDESAIAQAARDAWPLVRDADELHDALLSLGMMPEADLERGQGDPAGVHAWLAELTAAGRAVRAVYGGGRAAWVAAECADMVRAAFPDVVFEPQPRAVRGAGEPPTSDEAELVLVRGRVESIGPFTPAALADALGMSRSAVDIALASLEGTGNILRGRFTPGCPEMEFCDRRILARIHRDTIGRLRREVEPVSAAAFVRFLSRWQHVDDGYRLRGEDGLLQVVDQLQGFEAAAVAWETDVLPLRVADYRPQALDALCIEGDVVWGRFSRRTNGDGSPNRAALSRNGPISLGLRESLPWLIAEPEADAAGPVGAAGDVYELLSKRGASFLADIVRGTRRLPADVENALWQLVAMGLVTSDGFAGLRGLVNGTAKQVRQSPRFRRRNARRPAASRWSLLEVPPDDDWDVLPDEPVSDRSREPDEARASVIPAKAGIHLPDAESALDHVRHREPEEERAFQLLQRYGIVFPDLLAREPAAPPWRVLVRIYRRAEARGEIRGGRFVTGFIGEQFALPEAVEMMRSTRRAEDDGSLTIVSACDPLNLAGILSPGPRVPALPGNRVVYRGGVPIAAAIGGQLELRTETDPPTRTEISRSLGLRGPSLTTLPKAASTRR